MGLVKREQDSIDKRKYELFLSKPGELMMAEKDLLSSIDSRQLKIHTTILMTMLKTAKQLTT